MAKRWPDLTGSAGGGRRTGAEVRAIARNRLIESRLTPNAISLAGLVGNLVAGSPKVYADLRPCAALPLAKRQSYPLA